MQTLSIAQLTPGELPPPAHAIRAVVTLLWPFSSSTRQCALLLAEPDFRLRNHRGQVRVRFTNGSAEAVARGKVGIGDEVLLELRGATWAGDGANVATPGRGVDGELVFRGELGLTLAKKAHGEVVNAKINVNQSTPPPEEAPHSQEPRARHGKGTYTPARPVPSYLRNDVNGADVVPIYSSPAFVRRLRMSEDSKRNSWDPFAGVEDDLEEQPRKKQRISFGGVSRWRLAERTPSPAGEDEQAAEGMDGGIAAQIHAESPSRPRLLNSLAAGVAEEAPIMLPPPLPKLVMPDETPLLDSVTAARERPSTPKLQPVPSSALPLPSPFPNEAPRQQLSHSDHSTFAGDDHAETTANGPSAVPQGQIGSPSDSTRVAASTSVHQEHSEEDVTRTFDSMPTSAVGLQNESPTRPFEENRTPTFKDHHYSSQLSVSQIENLSDTEEDEDMYINHMRRRFPTFDERGYRRVDHQEEGYYDDTSEVESGEKEETEPETIIVQPEGRSDSGEDGGDEDEANRSEVEIRRPSPPESRERESGEGDQSGDAQQDAHTASQSITLTPAKARLRPLGFDGPTDSPTMHAHTPQSERDKIMKRTYSSLFGFKASLSPERKEVEEAQGLTQAPSFHDMMSAGGLQQAPRDVTERTSEQIPMELARNVEFTVKDQPSARRRDDPEAELELSHHDKFDLQKYTTEEMVESKEGGKVTNVENSSSDALPLGDPKHRVPQEPATGHAGIHATLPLVILEPDDIYAAGAVTAALDTVQDDVQGTPYFEEAISTPLEDAPLPQDRHVVSDRRELDDHMNLDDDDDVLNDEPAPTRNNSLSEVGASATVLEPSPPAPQAPDSPPELADTIGESQQNDRRHSQQPEEPVVLPTTAAAQPLQDVQVIDLDSSDDENERVPVLPDDGLASGPIVQPMAGIGEVETGSGQEVPENPYAQSKGSGLLNVMDTPGASQFTTQDSQRSAPGMIGTTQTTLDRSEVETPIPQDPDTMMAESMNDDGLWTQPQHQDFFSEQLHATELPGTQLPLTQNTIGPVSEQYNFPSFQSTTSVATDNSDIVDVHVPSNPSYTLVEESNSMAFRSGETSAVDLSVKVAVESAANISSPPSAEESLVEQTTLVVPEPLSAEILEDAHNHSDLPQLSAAVEPPSTEMDYTLIELAPSSPIELVQPQPPTPHTQQRHDDSLAIDESQDIGTGKDVLVTTVNVDSTGSQIYDPRHVTHSFGEGQDALVDSDHDQQWHSSVLPLSPEESQEPIESMPFETQLPNSNLPPTPQLTQGESLKGQRLEAMVEDVTNVESTVQLEPEAPKQSKRVQQVADEAKKTPVRRSPRKSQNNVQASPEPSEVSEVLHVPEDTPARRTRSKSSVSKTSSQSRTKGKTSAKKSNRKSQTSSQIDAESQQSIGDLSERPVTPPQVGGPISQDLLSPTKQTPVRRSPRTTQAESPKFDEGREVAQKSSTLESKAGEAFEPPQRHRAHQTVGKEAPAMEPDAETHDETSKSAAQKRTPAVKRSLTARLGNVPDAISNWFSPRRSTKSQSKQSKAPAADTAADDTPVIKRTPSNGFATKLAYYTPLSNLEQKLNPSSQSLENAVDVLAVVTDQTSPPERAKAGPKHFFTVFHITDPSLAAPDSTRVEVYRPWHATLPTADVGDVVLLRLFAVKSRRRQPYLLSTDSSGWCVWRHAEDHRPASPLDPISPQKAKAKGKAKASDPADDSPVWAQRRTRLRSGSTAAAAAATAGVREEIRGPPVELGAEERARAAELRAWWVGERGEGAAQPDEVVVTRTRSGKI